MSRWISRTAAASGVLLMASVVAGSGGVEVPAAAAGHPAFGTIGVGNYGASSLLTFAPGSTGDVPPVTSISGTTTTLSGPTGVAFDRAGRLYTANFGAGSVVAFSPGATGDVPPALTISGTNTTLTQPFGLAVTPSGNVWVANYGSNQILEFDAGSVGDVAPTRTITGPATGLTAVYGLALTPDGKGIWAVDGAASGSTVEREFSTKANGNAPPIRSIAGGQTQIDTPYGVAALLGGGVVFADRSTPPAILTFGAHASGNAAPRTVISGTNTGMNTPSLIGLNPVGEVWVPDTGNNAVRRFPANATGNASPDHQLAGTATTLSTPEGATVYIRPPTAPRALRKHVHHKTLKLHWHAPASSGGGIEGYVVRFAKHKSGTFHVVKTTTKRRYKKHHAKHGFYDVMAFNQAGFGAHSKRVHFR